ncbi:hypothetical protein [Streptomyces sulphureus]|uniref:hypothetical protein n=1 Tax=Streptomyces sulphureus TaxID=47758 RepID=UPI000370558B|nr:hypothetical protein [Streptomyces sulphureus]
MTGNTDRAAVLLTHCLVHRHGITVSQAFTAVDQVQRGETGPHTALVVEEARAIMRDMATAFAPVVEAFRRLAPAVQAAAAQLGKALNLQQPARSPRRDRPVWQSPYGPPARRRFR